VFSSNFDVNQNQHCCFAHGPAPSFPRPAHAFVHGPIMAHPDRTPPLRPCSRAATSGRPLPAPTGRAPLPAPDPGSPPLLFSSTRRPRADPRPPIFLPDATRARSFFPSVRATGARSHPAPPHSSGVGACHPWEAPAIHRIRALAPPRDSPTGSHRRAPRRPGAARPRRADVLHALVLDPPPLDPSAPHFSEPTSPSRSPSFSPAGKLFLSSAAGEHRGATPVRGRRPSGRPRPSSAEASRPCHPWLGRAGGPPRPALLLRAESRPNRRILFFQILF
jgi:hypothetical protein